MFNAIFTLGLSSPSTYSFSDDEDFTPFGEKIIDGHPSSNETNHELEQSLKRLALLDKTQEEIEKISKVFCGDAIHLEYCWHQINDYILIPLLILGCDKT